MALFHGPLCQDVTVAGRWASLGKDLKRGQRKVGTARFSDKGPYHLGFGGEGRVEWRLKLIRYRGHNLADAGPNREDRHFLTL